MDEPLKRPGILTANAEDAELVQSFLRKYRRPAPQIPANMPTACALMGATLIDLPEITHLADTKEVFIYWDDGLNLHRGFIEEVASFWNSRAPWEDYDFCVFPRSLEWCIGFTHNDSCVVSIHDTSFGTR